MVTTNAKNYLTKSLKRCLFHNKPIKRLKTEKQYASCCKKYNKNYQKGIAFFEKVCYIESSLREQNKNTKSRAKNNEFGGQKGNF